MYGVLRGVDMADPLTNDHRVDHSLITLLSAIVMDIIERVRSNEFRVSISATARSGTLSALVAHKTSPSILLVYLIYSPPLILPRLVPYLSGSTICLFSATSSLPPHFIELTGVITLFPSYLDRCLSGSPHTALMFPADVRGHSSHGDRPPNPHKPQ